jgi:hypothetical protein
VPAAATAGRRGWAEIEAVAFDQHDVVPSDVFCFLRLLSFSVFCLPASSWIVILFRSRKANVGAVGLKVSAIVAIPPPATPDQFDCHYRCLALRRRYTTA